VRTDPLDEAYFREAASWDADRVALRERSTRIAWRVAGLASALLLLSLLTLLFLMPLKHVEPFVIRVDSSTGVVDVVPVFAGQAPATEVLTRYLLDHYVTTCERFNFSTAESDYEECGAFHSAARNQTWFSAWDRANPASPLNVYKDGSTVRAQVSAVSFFKRSSGLQDLAQVRYTKALRSGGSGADQISHWIATVQYAYGEPSKDPRVRRWNPLGFKIEDFHAEPEVLPPEGAGASSGADAASADPHAVNASGNPRS
jgi:type IV secretion system protein VirB8